MLSHAIIKRNNMINKKPNTSENFVKLFHQFQQLLDIEREFKGLPLKIEEQIDLFEDWFFNQWKD
jgi:hypothetical protein